jgi:hypothetical protein
MKKPLLFRGMVGFLAISGIYFGIFRKKNKTESTSADVYIESVNPNIVCVKKANTTWSDFLVRCHLVFRKIVS